MSEGAPKSGENAGGGPQIRGDVGVPKDESVPSSALEGSKVFRDIFEPIFLLENQHNLHVLYKNFAPAARSNRVINHYI